MANPNKSLETMKKLDENLRHQSFKILDKFRKIRSSSKSTNEDGRKLNDVCNIMTEEQNNSSSEEPINAPDVTMRRRSTLTSPLEFQLQTNTVLKPKVNRFKSSIYSI